MKDETNRILAIFVPLIVFYLLLSLETNNPAKCSPISKTTFISRGAKTGAIFQHREQEKGLAIKTRKSASEPQRAVTVQDITLNDAPHRFKSVARQVLACALEGKPAKTFLVIFMGHSGSSAIMSELESHSQTFTETKEPVDHYEYELNTTLALKYSRDFFNRGVASGKIPGFKMRPNHIRKAPEAWAALAREFDTRIVWQYRDNILKQAVGEYSYKYLNDTSVLEGLRKEDVKNRCHQGVGCSFDIDNFDFFHQTLTHCLHNDLAITRGVHLIANRRSCVHALPYEDYLYDREKAMHSLRSFLGLRYEVTSPKRHKATSDNLCEVVTNWKELCVNFYGCHVWRHMFVDQRNVCSCDFSTGHVKYCDSTFQG